jgi:hypothetical protein
MAQIALRKYSALFVAAACFCILSVPSAAAATEMTSTLIVDGSRIDVTFESNDAATQLSQSDALHWVKMAAESVSTYYGRFPVPHLLLRVTPFDGTGVRHGETWGRSGGLISIHVGTQTSAKDFADDWMLTHEMIHLAFPSMADNHHWIEEGISVYVEPIARIQAGHLTAIQMWSDLIRDMPKGLPQEGDKGIDHTHTWGRTYWGGALFAFVADVEIRKQTQNKKGLEDALRAILNAGGNINEDWDLEKALRIGDQAVGVEVLMPLYEKWKDQPVNVDLPGLWNQLGISRDSQSVHLDDTASLAAIRRSITMPMQQHSENKSAAVGPAIVNAGRTATRHSF